MFRFGRAEKVKMRQRDVLMVVSVMESTAPSQLPIGHQPHLSPDSRQTPLFHLSRLHGKDCSLSTNNRRTNPSRLRLHLPSTQTSEATTAQLAENDRQSFYSSIILKPPDIHQVDR
jgi:hypothetical protein